MRNKTHVIKDTRLEFTDEPGGVEAKQSDVGDADSQLTDDHTQLTDGHLTVMDGH